MFENDTHGSVERVVAGVGMVLAAVLWQAGVVGGSVGAVVADQVARRRSWANRGDCGGVGCVGATRVRARAIVGGRACYMEQLWCERARQYLQIGRLAPPPNSARQPNRPVRLI